MSVAEEPKIGAADIKDSTTISFSPDLTQFGMDSLDVDTISLLSKRVYDVAATLKNVRVHLNDKLILTNVCINRPIKSLSSFYVIGRLILRVYREVFK